MPAKKKRRKVKVRKLFDTRILILAFVIALIAAFGVPAYAQTPVPLIVDTNQIFTSTNSWIATFIPIMAIGIGISVALAILTFIGAQIVKAFRGSGR